MTRTHIPEPILTAAHERSKARAARDWSTADRLRDEIEAAGWRIVDSGTDFRLEPRNPPDIVEGAIVRYGSSDSVPSRLEDPASGIATIILVATDWPDDVGRALDALAATSPSGTQVVVVADGPSEEQAVALEGRREAPETEIVWTSARLGQAAALNAAIRRAAAGVIVLLDPSIEPTGDIVSPLVDALRDETVAVAGPLGFVSEDLRSFEDAMPGDAVAIGGYCLAFRRSDYVEREPFDERFRYYRNLDIWWSLVLRDAGEGGQHRRAQVVDGLPFQRHEHRGWTSLSEGERGRLSKRNFYRIIDRFGNRPDLVVDGSRSNGG